MKQIVKITILATAFLLSLNAFAQRSVRVGFVDLDYVLTKIPAYDVAEKNLEAKIELWKQEIAARELFIEDMRKALEVERVLLTEELIKDREIEINAATEELLQYKQQRFGPTGDLMFQRKAIMQPIQDEVFLIIKRLGEEKKYDFIFEKSEEANLLYSQKRYDLSDLVIREFAKEDRKTNYQNSDQEINASQERDEETNEVLDAREKEKEDALKSRQAEIDAKKQAAADARAKRKAEYEAKKKAMMDAKNNTSASEVKSEVSTETSASTEDQASKAATVVSDKSSEVVQSTTVSNTLERTADSTTGKKQSLMDERAKRKAEYEARKKMLRESKNQTKE